MARDTSLTETAMWTQAGWTKAGRNEAGTAFDMWLHGTLSTQFGGPDAECVPDELLRLLPERDEDDAA